ncbi:hypothetical protein [Candidatus Roseilinea sp. NK_OTU-006]|jgi:hypothetical protein|uniref:hypothetical protein n=1 Tax=Candidatus Roseilinea sp. NK_OTU-006 TaxID=2704250 RepID=UPI00145E5DAE|nr:hypothetical protein [Candidatus Roseilinea sp. NK_OTU-006]
MAHWARHLHWVVWNTECLTRHLSRTAYADRLFVAHFAVITFGLVALWGAWRDPTYSLHVALGLGALLALIWIGPSGQTGGPVALALQVPDGLFICFLREARRTWALRELLEFIRRAHLSCGAPPCPMSNYSCLKGGGSMHDPTHRALAFFDFKFQGG